MERDKAKRKTKVKFLAPKTKPQKVNISFYVPTNKRVKFTATKKEPQKVKIKFYEE